MNSRYRIFTSRFRSSLLACHSPALINQFYHYRPKDVGWCLCELILVAHLSRHVHLRLTTCLLESFAAHLETSLQSISARVPSCKAVLIFGIRSSINLSNGTGGVSGESEFAPKPRFQCPNSLPRFHCMTSYCSYYSPELSTFGLPSD